MSDQRTSETQQAVERARDEMLWYGKQLGHLGPLNADQSWRDRFRDELAHYEAAVRADERARIHSAAYDAEAGMPEPPQ